MNSGNFVDALLAVNIGSLFIEKPLMLLIVALPLVVLFTLPFALVTRKENVNGHSIASYIMHVVLAIIIGLAAAGTSWITTLTETDVYVVADVSYSANKNLGEIDDIIKNQIILPRNSKLGVVCFGKDYELLCDLGAQKKAKSVKESTVDDSETNIAEALSFAGSLFKGNVIKKIVLITDGKQTDESDTYAVKRVIDSLESLDIEVNAIYLDDNIDPDTPEVQISGAEFTRSAYLNHKEWAYVTVQTSYATRAVMTLKSGDGTKLQERLVDLEEGNNRVSFSLDTSRSGTFDYVVTVSAEDDTSDYNNSYSFTQTVSSDFNVLLISGDWNSCTALVDQYAESAAIDAYECDSSVTISRKNSYWNSFTNGKVHGYNCNPDVVANYRDVPFTVEDLCIYDEIILADIDITKLAQCEEFVRNLDTAVSLFGKSLITVGNVYTQDVSDIYSEAEKGVLKSLSGMLPVRYGQSDEDPKLYTLVLDASRSMSDMTPARIAMEKQIALNILSALNDIDEVCIVVFYGEAYVMQQPTSLDKRDAIIDSINNLSGIQGTVIAGGLKTAYNSVGSLPGYAEKQVMLISDFLDSQNDFDPVTDAANALRDYEVVTSCVNVNKSNATSSALANSIATAGGGTVFHLNSVSDDLGSIKFDQLVGREKDKIPSGNFSVSVDTARANDDVLANISVTDLPAVNQFILGVSQPSAVSVLQLDYKKKGSEVVSKVPLYSYWNYGNGKVSSFTSSLKGGWSDNWQQGQMQIFLDNVLDTITPSEKAAYPYVLDVQQEESFTRVQIIPADLHFGTPATIKLTRPDGEIIEESLIFDTYYFYYEFKSVDVGKYQIEVNYNYNNVDYRASTAVNVSYTSEYNAFTAFEPSMLFKAVGSRGTVITEGSLAVTNDNDLIGTYTLDFTYGLLIAAVALYVVDIVVRKLKWEDIVSFFGRMTNKKAGGNAQ